MNTNLAEFIKKNFMGATITVVLVFGGTVTGEVVDGFDNIIGLRQANGAVGLWNISIMKIT